VFAEYSPSQDIFQKKRDKIIAELRSDEDDERIKTMKKPGARESLDDKVEERINDEIADIGEPHAHLVLIFSQPADITMKVPINGLQAIHGWKDLFYRNGIHIRPFIMGLNQTTAAAVRKSRGVLETYLCNPWNKRYCDLKPGSWMGGCILPSSLHVQNKAIDRLKKTPIPATEFSVCIDI